VELWPHKHPAVGEHSALLCRALLEYGCHRPSCGMTQHSETRCTCLLRLRSKAVGDRVRG
jgi:hypothetical protein